MLLLPILHSCGVASDRAVWHNGLLATCATMEIARHSGLIPSGRCTTLVAGRVEGIKLMACNMMLMLTARMAVTTAASTVAAILEQAQAPS